MSKDPKKDPRKKKEITNSHYDIAISNEDLKTRTMHYFTLFTPEEMRGLMTLATPIARTLRNKPDMVLSRAFFAEIIMEIAENQTTYKNKEVPIDKNRVLSNLTLVLSNVQSYKKYVAMGG